MLLGLSAKEKAVFISLVVNACYPSKTEGNVTIFLLKACLLRETESKSRKAKHYYTQFSKISSHLLISSTQGRQICHFRHCMHFWTYLTFVYPQFKLYIAHFQFLTQSFKVWIKADNPVDKTYYAIHQIYPMSSVIHPLYNLVLHFRTRT